MRRPVKPFSVEVKRSRRGPTPVSFAPPPQAVAPAPPVFQAPAPVTRAESVKIQGRILEALVEPAPLLREEPESPIVSEDMQDGFYAAERAEPVRRPRGRPRKIPLAVVAVAVDPVPVSEPVLADAAVDPAPVIARVVVRKIRKTPASVVIEAPAPVFVASPTPFVFRIRPEAELKRGDKWKRRLPKILRQGSKRSVG